MEITIEYEWVIDEMDEYDELADRTFYSTLEGVSFPLPADQKLSLTIGQNIEYDGSFDETISRDWANVIGGILPSVFDEGEAIPNRFHEELTAAQDAAIDAPLVLSFK